MKLLALYLPQYHNIPENDEWWGDGFTEWTNVRAGKPYFEGHSQPRVPLDGNYYDLLDNDVQLWQARLAKEYGIYGFCYYHYWFGEKMLLERPMEQMLADKRIDLPFCVCWANEDWTKAWVGEERVTLIKQEYGDESEWRRHFEYLLPFFRDERYIKVDGKPFFFIYRSDLISCLRDMVGAWDRWAREEGFPGMCFVHRTSKIEQIAGCDEELFDYLVEWQPSTALSYAREKDRNVIKRVCRVAANAFYNVTGLDIRRRYSMFKKERQNKVTRISYDEVWERVLEMPPLSNHSIPGAFSMWDNTCRHGLRGSAYVGANPSKFEKYLTQQIRRARDVYGSEIMVFFAWNEWAEGGYLEPDEEFGYGYLEAVRNALIACGEWQARDTATF